VYQQGLERKKRKEVVQPHMQKYYITESLGEVRKRTPEGYLLCVGVPIARTGEYEYADHEMADFQGGEDGVVVCERPAEVVFADETVASFEGKPFVVGHPDELVDVTNWGEYAAGVVQNVRRGEGADSDLLMADILVTKPQAIEEINGGVRQVSCGYDAEYQQVEPGRVRLTEVIGNHVALVEKGRAGHRVAIGDGGDPPKKIRKEADSTVDKENKEKKIKLLDWLREGFLRAKDEGVVLEVSAEPPTEPTEPAPEAEAEKTAVGDSKRALDALNSKFDALSAKLDEFLSELKKPSGQEPEEKSGQKTEEDSDMGQEPEAPQTKTEDAATPLSLDASKVMEFRRAAEILAPGFDVRGLTLDSSASVAGAMRKVLAEGYAKDNSIRRDVEEMHGEVIRSWMGVEDAEVKVLFASAAREKGKRNNDGAKVGVKDFAVVGGLDVLDIQKMHQEFWCK
jgi:hypothetical protein